MKLNSFALAFVMKAALLAIWIWLGRKWSYLYVVNDALALEFQGQGLEKT